MTSELAPMLMVFIINAVLGLALVVSVYRFMESRIVLGAVAGLVLGAAIIVAEVNLGELVFDLTYDEMRVLASTAAVGGVTGVTGTTLILKPSLN